MYFTGVQKIGVKFSPLKEIIPMVLKISLIDYYFWVSILYIHTYILITNILKLGVGKLRTINYIYNIIYFVNCCPNIFKTCIFKKNIFLSNS